MNISMEEKKNEAVARMVQWGIYPKTVFDFKMEGVISESVPPFGAHYWIEGEQLERVKEFEELHNALVYHVIHSFTEIGEMESYLFVSDHPEEWEMDRADIKDGQQFVWVYNHDVPHFSEFGKIGIQRTAAAGLQRVW